MNKLCYVTAFLDIGRSDWKYFNRKTEDYIETFKNNLLSHFENMDIKTAQNYCLVIFIDKKYFIEIAKLIAKCEARKNIYLIPVSENLLFSFSTLWQRLKREEEILSSESYRNAFKNRLKYPENSQPKYTLINHAKIDFIIEASTFIDSEYFCWVDFGYIDIPKNPLDINRMNLDKVNYNLINPLTERDKDILYTMIHAPERIGGGFFFCKRDIALKYQQLYHETHLEFQNNNLADDDQHLVLRCYYKNPDLFHLHSIGGWFRMLSHYQIKTKKVISFCLWGDKLIYTKGAIENAKLALQLYPNWECWFYIHECTVPKEIIKELQSFSNVRIILKKENIIRPRRYMLWRFEPADDESVFCFISRDTDSRLTQREFLAVEEWLKSNKSLHIMRDHPQHYPPILGGMFGLICSDKLDKIKSCNSWEEEIDLFYKYATENTDDQIFLSKGIYPNYEKDRIIHDEIMRREGDECKPFPTKWPSNGHYIGCYVSPENVVDLETTTTLINYVKNKLPYRITNLE